MRCKMLFLNTPRLSNILDRAILNSCFYAIRDNIPGVYCSYALSWAYYLDPDKNNVCNPLLYRLFEVVRFGPCLIRSIGFTGGLSLNLTSTTMDVITFYYSLPKCIYILYTCRTFLLCTLKGLQGFSNRI